MKDEYVIKLKDDAKPFALTVPRKVPMPLYKETKHEIERMLKSGVISPEDHPTEWCAPIVETPKTNSKVIVCVDLQSSMSMFSVRITLFPPWTSPWES